MTFRDKEIMRIRLWSTSDPSQNYTIEVCRNPQRVSCTCIGNRTHGYCKHTKFYKQLIEDYLRDDTPFTGPLKGG